VTRPAIRPALKPTTMHTSLLRTVLLVGFAAFTATGAAAADIAAGKAKADTVCAACHGKDGNTPIDPSYPKLAGQHRDFLEHALRAYQSGTRKNAIMAGQAQPLSRADIENLSAYYASLPGSLRTRR
jgi:cytochrome c553